MPRLLHSSTDAVSLIMKDLHLWVGASADADGTGDQLAVGCLGCGNSSDVVSLNTKVLHLRVEATLVLQGFWDCVQWKGSAVA